MGRAIVDTEGRKCCCASCSHVLVGLLQSWWTLCHAVLEVHVAGMTNRPVWRVQGGALAEEARIVMRVARDVIRRTVGSRGAIAVRLVSMQLGHTAVRHAVDSLWTLPLQRHVCTIMQRDVGAFGTLTLRPHLES